MTTAPRRILIKGAQIVTMDDALGDIDRGDILVSGNTIEKVAPSIAAQADETIDASRLIVMPGLIDAHNHVWETVLRGMGGSLWSPGYYREVLPRRWHFRAEDLYNSGFAAGYELISPARKLPPLICL